VKVAGVDTAVDTEDMAVDTVVDMEDTAVDTEDTAVVMEDMAVKVDGDDKFNLQMKIKECYKNDIWLQ
jgi:hypothetical protein